MKEIVLPGSEGEEGTAACGRVWRTSSVSPAAGSKLSSSAGAAVRSWRGRKS